MFLSVISQDQTPQEPQNNQEPDIFLGKKAKLIPMGPWFTFHRMGKLCKYTFCTFRGFNLQAALKLCRGEKVE